MTSLSLRSRSLLLSALICQTFACSDDASPQGEGSESDTNTSDATGTSSGESDSQSETDTADTDTDTEDTDGAALRPNWHEDVAPLVTESCGGCHVTGGIAPFSLETYEEAAAWSALMADAAESRLMPPWHASADQCDPLAPFAHDPSLDDDQIEMLREWSDIGSPEGDPSAAAPLPAAPDLELANPSVTVLMDSPVEVEAEGSTLDFTHCLSFDPGNDEDVFIDGLQVVQGNRKVLHHVLMYVDESAESAQWEGGVKYDCGGGSGLSGSSPLVGAWVPGSLPLEPPTDVAVPLPAGARIVYNVHYHATGAGQEVDDSTGLALRWSTQAPKYTALFALIGAPGLGESLTGPLHIPADTKDHVEEFEWTVDVGGNGVPDLLDVRIWTIANHMHKVGVDMRVWIEDAQGEESCLLRTPNWDFNWQRFYSYDQPIEQGYKVQNGDTVHVRCEYDNTLDNPGVVSALAEVGLDSPVDVFLGEGTLDEMCLAAVGVGYSVF